MENEKPLTFAELQSVNSIRCVTRTGFNHNLSDWSVAEWTNAAIGELGEACNIAKKMLRHRDGVAGNQGEDQDLEILKKKLGHELADAVIYIDLVATSQGLRLGELVREKFNLTSEKIGYCAPPGCKEKL